MLTKDEYEAARAYRDGDRNGYLDIEGATGTTEQDNESGQGNDAVETPTDDVLTITVTGRVGAGKSGLAALVALALRHVGFSVENQDDDTVTEDRIEKIGKSLIARKAKIVIKTQLPTFRTGDRRLSTKKGTPSKECVMTDSKYAGVLKAVQEAPNANQKFDASIIGIVEVRNQIALRNVPVEYVVLSENLWKFLVYKDEDFPKVVEPVAEEDTKEGVACLVYGMICLVDNALPDNTIGVYSSFPGLISERVFRCTMMVPR